MREGVEARRRRFVVAAVGVIGSAALLTAAAVLLRPGDSVDPTTAAIRSAAQGVINTLYYDDFPPIEFSGGLLAAADRAVMRTRITTDFERYFTPQLEARYKPQLLDFVDSIGRSDWDAAGGLSRIDWHSLMVGSNEARLSVRTSGWVLRRRAADGDLPAPTYRLESTYDWEFTLKRTGEVWRVDDFTSTCVAGCP